MIAFHALKIIKIIISIAVFFQTLEYLILRDSFGENGIWRWSEIKTEFDFLPKPIRLFFNFVLADQKFKTLLWLRLISSFIFMIYPNSFLLILFIFLTSLLISQRFRGSFNGGSDYMALIVLSALCVQAAAPTIAVTKGILWYIALQSATSYFMAGLVKIKLRSWRSAQALKDIIHSPNYSPPTILKKLLDIKLIAATSAWLVILFEITFPLIFTQHGQYVLLWLAIAFLFHLLNVFIFGLNRFLIVWLATYPAIYFVLEKSFSNSP